MARADGKGKLERYQERRDFGRTPEPAGAPGRAGEPTAPRFVVQRHRARRLHYDLRFEVDGVLVSWAVPRGPTLDPKARRIAIHVEDHPLEYVDFEGVIPAGEYGGGDVIVWDRGTWEPHGTNDPAEAVAAGELHAEVHGEKLSGRLVLVRTGTDGAKERWLLLHKNDDHAVGGWDAEDHPRSVLSGRTNDEVKADPELLWRSDVPADQASVRLRPSHVSPPTAEELDALDGLPDRGGTWTIFGRDLRVTNLDRELFPGQGRQKPVSKRELLRYAACVAPTVLPYLVGRPLNLHRFPNGVQAKGSWHRRLPSRAPDWLPRWESDSGPRLVVDEPAALVWVANFGSLEWHPWTSTTEAPQRPSYALIDIDPGDDTTWDDVLTLARLHRTALQHLGIQAMPKVTGRRGIQIWIPIASGPTFDDSREWVAQLSRSISAVVPELVSWKWEVRERGGKARLDYTQNAINKTLVAPYSPRPAAGAPVSAPIRWDELDDPHLRPDRWTIRTITQRLADHGDLFAPVLARTQQLSPLT